MRLLCGGSQKVGRDPLLGCIIIVYYRVGRQLLNVENHCSNVFDGQSIWNSNVTIVLRYYFTNCSNNETQVSSDISTKFKPEGCNFR